MSEPRLAGRSAVVVGGTRGIGRAVGELLAELGAAVLVNGRDEAAVEQTTAALRARGHTAAGFAGSPADESTAAALIDAALDTHGGLDILINCAGIAEPVGSSILTVTGAQFQELIDAHLGTVFHTCRAAAPHLVAQRTGAIVNTSSFAFLGDYGGTGYPAGKGAVNGLTMAIAAELAEHGVRANVVCPGARTRLSTGPDYEQQITELNRRGLLDDASTHGARDVAPPEYVAPLYAYLVSDLASAVTGQILIGAGGFVGRFDRPSPTLLGYRDHHDTPPWTLTELHAMVAG
ncbi:SDR family NAD(P)-dependent oxidoreductase [[Mycobacterium] wendilense]|uniref:SDR family oxidoreductase n=1 Tax=[Mycobacterium] wendilense TaxID=3064284 RepID=A0ABN9P509_9MYCO|nr:SDR family NAD(P)-dependent oxidoreductase [Mycolicibacterium sp. MU0050]CAJ1582564.1 SDR family oxidoreductase [Mycolicibacterium sp. MU0050]